MAALTRARGSQNWRTSHARERARGRRTDRCTSRPARPPTEHHADGTAVAPHRRRPPRRPAEATAEAAGRTPCREATRRRAAPLNQPEQTEAPVEASTGAAGSGEAPQAEVFAPIAGDLDAAPKTPRRRRKATAVEATAEEPLVAAAAEAASAEVVRRSR